MQQSPLDRYRVTGGGPLYLKMGRLVFYRRSDLDRWLEGRIRRSTSDPGPDSDRETRRKKTRRPEGSTRRPPSDSDSESPND